MLSDCVSERAAAPPPPPQQQGVRLSHGATAAAGSSACASATAKLKAALFARVKNVSAAKRGRPLRSFSQRYFDALDVRVWRARTRGLMLPRAPLLRVWPVIREAAAVMGVTVALVLSLPPAFDALPAPFDVRTEDPAGQQALAAILGAGVVGLLFLGNFCTYALLYIHRKPRMLHALISLWIVTAIAGPLALLLRRLCEAAGIPLDAATLCCACWNIAVPGVVLAQWAPTKRQFATCRRLYADVLATGLAWVLAYMPYPTLIGILVILAALDVFLVAMPCCSPVQRLDKLYAQRANAGEPQLPGFTFDLGARDDLILGLGDFIVFSVFVGQGVRAGVAPLSAISVGVLAGLVLLMLHVSLQWPLRALEPAIPLSVVLGAVLLAAERLVLRPFADELAGAGVWL